MGLFSKKEAVSPGLIGVDIGGSGIKAVELLPDKGRLKLATYGYSLMEKHDPTLKPLLDDPKRAAVILNRILSESGMKSRKANASLPSQSIFHAIITIPAPKSVKEDIKPLVEAQIRKLLPVPLESMILDSTIIDKDLMPKAETAAAKAVVPAGSPAIDVDKAAQMADSRKYVRVLVSGAPKDLVQKYVDIFKEAKIELTSLETEAFAIIRSLIGKDKARIMLVDLGYERTNISIVDNGIPMLHRSVKAGGAQVTAVIAKKMGLDMASAEQAKMDLGGSGAQGEIPPVLKEAMMPILHEVRYSLDLYLQQQSKGTGLVEKIILTGGSANLPQIDKFLTNELKINVYIGNPWARVATFPELRPVLEEIGSRFSVAIGLAMKLLP